MGLHDDIEWSTRNSVMHNGGQGGPLSAGYGL
jgi:hypothetical protein